MHLHDMVSGQTTDLEKGFCYRNRCSNVHRVFAFISMAFRLVPSAKYVIHFQAIFGRFLSRLLLCDLFLRGYIKQSPA